MRKPYNDRGWSLIAASPESSDPIFEESVILIIDDNEDGTFGIVMNKPEHKTLSEMSPEFDNTPLADAPVFDEARRFRAADAVVVGAGAGLSASAGFDYGGARFRAHFADFEARYGFHDIVLSGIPELVLDHAGSRVSGHGNRGVCCAYDDFRTWGGRLVARFCASGQQRGQGRCGAEKKIMIFHDCFIVYKGIRLEAVLKFMSAYFKTTF